MPREPEVGMTGKPLHLVFAIKRLEQASGGSERVLAHLTDRLVRRGHKVTVVTMDRPETTPFYPLNPQVHLVNRGVGDSARPTRLGEMIGRIVDLRAAVRDLGPDVAVGFGHSIFVPLAFALAGSGIPVVASEHAARAHYRTRPLDYLLFRLAARLSKVVTVTTEAVGADYTPDVRRLIAVAPNPIMIPPRAAARRTGRTVLNVGRLDAQKDQAVLIRAFGLIAEDFPEWTLTLLGEGSLRPQLEGLVESLGLSGRIRLPGVTTEVVRAYAGADVFALSSLYESFGLATLEAMAQGLPVLGFADCPGTNEVVIDEETGLLVAPTPSRIEAFAEGLRRLMGDAALRERLGEAGRARAERLEATDTAVDQWEALLKTTARPG